jgi:hypothetical protein
LFSNVFDVSLKISELNLKSMSGNKIFKFWI